MPNYYRNVDDAHSDPDLIAGRYQVGRSIFFEVALTLAEYAENIRSAGGGSSSQTPQFIEATGLESPTSPGCPREDQYVWVGEPGEKPRPIKAKSLLTDEWMLYNPLSRNFNKMISVERQDDVPTLEIVTKEKVHAVVSDTHIVIRNTGDADGFPLKSMLPKDEILIVQKGLNSDRRSQWSPFQDGLKDVISRGKGRCIKISLESEFIYCVGSTPDEMTLAHNRKPIFTTGGGF